MTIQLEEQQSEAVQRDYGRLLQDSIDRIQKDCVENFIPHPGTILVRPDPPDTKSDNGIILPDCAIKQKLFGTVLAVHEASSSYAIGDRVLFRARAGTKITFPDVGECLILQYCGDIDDEILGKFRR
jgi:co-chaperonin GroES (HSP10)